MKRAQRILMGKHGAFITKAGTVLDLGATAMPRRFRVIATWRRTPEAQTFADWGVVAADFNRIARSKQNTPTES